MRNQKHKNGRLFIKQLFNFGIILTENMKILTIQQIYQSIFLSNYMIANNPYNLPEKIIKPNQIIKPIPLQNKKSRDRSQQFSKEISAKGIKLQSQMKKSIHLLQHVTSSPNLHTPSTPSSSQRQIEPQPIPRPLQYHANHIIQAQQYENDRKIKFLFEKFYQIAEQLNSHQSLMYKLISQKQKSQRNSRDLSFDFQNQKVQKDQNFRNQTKGLHLNQNNANLVGSQNTFLIRQIQQVKKDLNGVKQQVSQLRVYSYRERQQQSGHFNKAEEKVKQELSRICYTFQQLKSFSHQKFNKIENTLMRLDGNSQAIGQKSQKTQQRIESLESNIENHMNLVNQQINNALSKIVASINQKISKALENSILHVNQKLKKNLQICKGLIDNTKKIQNISSSQNLQTKTTIINAINIKSSAIKSKSSTAQIQIKSVVECSKNKTEDNSKKDNPNFIHDNTKNQLSSSQIVLGCQTYYIDEEGYLLDQNHFYLTDQNNHLLQLQQSKINQLKPFFQNLNPY